MNPPNPPTNPNNPPPLPQTDPLPPDLSVGGLLQTLLKRPVQLIAELQRTSSDRQTWILVIFAIAALAGYGGVVGSFSGGQQWLAAPLKISTGALASSLICLPSLFIFTALSGGDVTMRGVVGALSAALALTALMLIGLVPVAWVFSQSTDSVVFMGTLHLGFWLTALVFGLRLLRLLLDFLGVRERMHLRAWTFIFVLVSLQMTTALRPIVGSSDHWFSPEKKFFAAYWVENLGEMVRNSTPGKGSDHRE